MSSTAELIGLNTLSDEEFRLHVREWIAANFLTADSTDENFAMAPQRR